MQKIIRQRKILAIKILLYDKRAVENIFPTLTYLLLIFFDKTKSSRSQIIVKIGVLKNWTIFTGKPCNGVSF